MKKTEKHLEYSSKLVGHFALIFDEKSDYYINPADFQDEKSLTAFVHSLANVFPNHIFNKLTGNDINTLEFNHMANQLCFQFMTLNKKP